MNKKYQVAVLGSGSEGSEAALLAAKAGYTVVIVENGMLGGARLHHGSYAVRALHAFSRLHREFLKGKKYGTGTDLFTDSLVQWMKAQRAASSRLARRLQSDLEELSVRVVIGSGTMVDEHLIRVTNENGKQEDIEGENIILATGARPDYVSYQNSRILNSDAFLDRLSPPAHLFIVGGGYVGCEFAAIYRGFGCQVTLAEQRDRLLPTWDESVGSYLAQRLTEDGVQLKLGKHIPVEDVPRRKGWPIIIEAGAEIAPDLLLVATGRRPNFESLGLAELGIITTPYIKVDRQLRTDRRNI